jgi:hypothetical protein
MCRGYSVDCLNYLQQHQPPLAALANAFNSAVGITLYNVNVNGIPYYPINEEGAVGVGDNIKVSLYVDCVS